MQHFASGKGLLIDHNERRRRTTAFHQIVNVMKLTFLLLLTGFLTARGNIYGQQFSIDVKNQPLEAVCSTIEKQSNYVFLLNSTVDKAAPVTANIKSDNIQEVLKSVLKELDIDFIIKGRTIILARREKKEKRFNEQSAGMLGKDDPIEVIVRVTNEEGEPVAGVTVQVKGERIVGATNGDGVAKIKVDRGVVVVLTAVNILPEERVVSGEKELFVQVKGKTGKLDEVQVIAYGTTSQRFNTGNVTSVKASDIAKQPIDNPLLALQGRVPGLYINQLNGLPGGGINISIQGLNSISSGNNPFYVVDGVPFNSEMISTVGRGFGNFLGGQSATGGSGSPLFYINPSDIESIDILKDADATAIYGSRAANGAILITTKRGKIGQNKVDINVQQGWGRVVNTLDLLDTKEYLRVRREGINNDNSGVAEEDYDINGFWDTTRYTNWQKELIGNTSQFLHLTGGVSGGTKALQYLISGTFQRQTSVFPGKFDDKRGAVHLSLNGTSNNDRFRFGIVANYMSDKNTLPASDLASKAVVLAPTAPKLYNEDGTLNWEPTEAGVSTWENPLIDAVRGYENLTSNLIASGSLSYRLLSGLVLKSNFGFNKMETDEFSGWPPDALQPEYRINFGRVATYSFNKTNSWSIEPQLVYNQDFNQIKVDAVLGGTWQHAKSNGYVLEGTGYASDDLLRDLRSATTLKTNFSEQSLYRYNALFGRVNLIYKNAYILNVSGRRDGSSRFGEENKLHNFWSVGAGWIFTENRWMKDHFSILKYGKMRFSYGTSGNDQFGNYRYLSLYNSTSYGIPYQSGSSLNPTGHSNPMLQWEVTKKLMAGLDLAFLNERFGVSVNYIVNRSSNQLLSYLLPYYSGFNVVAMNFPALVQNKEWQFSANLVNIRTKSFSWSTDLNLTIPENKLIEFQNLANSSYANLLVIGQPISILKRYRYAGIDATTGKYQVLDSKGDPTFAPVASDRTSLIDQSPEWYGGMANNFTFLNFEVSCFIQFTKKIAPNYFGGAPYPGFAFVNQPSSVLNRWQSPGDGRPVQYFTSTASNANEYYLMKDSDKSFSDASFVRLKNVSISYRLSEAFTKRIKLSTVRLYANAQNLVTISGFDGLDPETGAIGLPPLRIVTVGLQVVL
ncbi:MAG: SusC/RagA family TonB-linked outer membrane protein [Flavobacterium psychrophilum]|nr:MAG: SusC/RagA family TonB-linked outer membrane protein [Flavobacterium psychrophilum]